ncbi:MAG: 4Fe-4S ferredoxin [Chloroflexi bacterium]|nr:4Fe-4S ferredoxin [Chloroflexota bacterium]
MSQLPAEVRACIAEWLAQGEIDLFIGYEASSLPFQATPAFIRQPEEVDRLIWDATCENNLVSFLKRYRGQKVGIMLKGCDARSLVSLMREGQWIRERLRIVAAACPGVLDVRRMVELAHTEIENLPGQLLPQGWQHGETLTPLADIRHVTCALCLQHTPTDYDLLVGDPPPEEHPDSFAAVREIEALSSDERWQFFTQELSKCNLCYTCRNTCPMCYCNVCFVDQDAPRWFTATTAPPDIHFYQVMRTFHLAGRCAGCYACTRVCPQGVNLWLLLDKLRADVWELYQDDAGTNPDAKPPLTTYREEDDNSFVL